LVLRKKTEGKRSGGEGKVEKTQKPGGGMWREKREMMYGGYGEGQEGGENAKKKHT